MTFLRLYGSPFVGAEKVIYYNNAAKAESMENAEARLEEIQKTIRNRLGL